MQNLYRKTGRLKPGCHISLRVLSHSCISHNVMQRKDSFLQIEHIYTVALFHAKNKEGLSLNWKRQRQDHPPISSSSYSQLQNNDHQIHY